jgi:hypothetical protein
MDDCKDMQALAKKADGLMALHLPQQHEIAAVADGQAEAAKWDAKDSVAAVAKAGKKQFKKGKAAKRTNRDKLRKSSRPCSRRSAITT